MLLKKRCDSKSTIQFLKLFKFFLCFCLNFLKNSTKIFGWQFFFWNLVSIWFCFVKCEEFCPWEQLIFGVKINNWSRNLYRTNVTLSLMLRRQCVILRLNVGKSQRPWNCSNQRSFECCDVESAKPFHCQWMYFAIAHRRSWFKSVRGVPSTKGNGNAHALY